MYSTHKMGMSVVAERFIRTLKNIIYRYMFSVSKYMDIDKLDDIVNKYNNTHHIIIKIKPFDVKLSTYIDFNKWHNKEDPKFEVDHHPRTSKYKNIFLLIVFSCFWKRKYNFLIKNPN